MYSPDPNSNIGQIYAIIPNNKAVTAHELQQILSNINPDFPIKSVNTHLRFLEQKGLVFRQRFEGLSYFSREKGKQKKEVEVEELEPQHFISEVTKGKKMTLGGQVLEYCKKYVGKRVSSSAIREYLGATNTGYLDILKRLREANVIQLIPNTSPWEYLILPDIKVLDKVPTKKDLGLTNTPSIIHKHENIEPEIKNNIANMSLGDILSEYVVLKQENQRLREALERMGMEFIQLGILEGD